LGACWSHQFKYLWFVMFNIVTLWVLPSSSQCLFLIEIVKTNSDLFLLFCRSIWSSWSSFRSIQRFSSRELSLLLDPNRF
jgi:hypothetical protein